MVTSEETKLTVDSDSLNQPGTEKNITADRSEKPISLTAYNDSLAKTIEVKSRNSFAYWLNLYPNWHLWTGFLIDTKTKKRYTYPKTVYLDLQDTTGNYLTYVPLEEPYDQYPGILKITPLKLVGLINPSVELSYERRTGKRFSTQLMASYLLPNSLWNIGAGFNPNIRGFRFAIEEKLYLKKSANLGPYLGLEVNYMKNKYHDVWNFGTKDIFSDPTYNFTNYPDTFGIRKQTCSINLKFGYQAIEKRLAVDLYAGLGIRYRDVSHFDRINPEDEMEMTRHPNIFLMANADRKHWTISIPLNLRVGWTF